MTRRMARNICGVLRDYPEHSLEWVRWTGRPFYRCDDGAERSLAQLWSKGQPAVVNAFTALMQSIDQPFVYQFL